MSTLDAGAVERVVPGAANVPTRLRQPGAGLEDEPVPGDGREPTLPGELLPVAA